MERIKSITRTLRLDHIGRAKKMEKLLVIVDEGHLDMLYEMNDKQRWGIQVAYILTDTPLVNEIFPRLSRIFPLSANIRNLLRYDVIDEIVCCTSTLPDDYLHSLASICEQFGVSLLIQPYMKCNSLQVSDVRQIADYYFLALDTNPRKRLEFAVKTFFEVSFAIATLILLLPWLLIIAVLIKTTSKGPLIFKQVRVGLRGRKFYMYKFRTMVNNAEKLKMRLSHLNEADGPAFKIKNDPRITLVGKILRKTGLDEIPQLFNVVKGDMSLIGPRPMVPDEVMEQEEWQLKRMCVKPGLTCTWQIQPERNKVPFDEWMRLDKDYVENWSIGSDIRIFLHTVKSIFFARGA